MSNPTDARPTWSLLLPPLLVLAGLAVFWWVHHVQRQRAKQAEALRQYARGQYARVEEDIVAVLTARLKSLPEDDPIIRRYGKFVRLRKTSDVSKPDYTWQLIERFDFPVVLEFEKANAQLGLGITRGPAPAITRLTMAPSEEWLEDHPENFGGFAVQNINGIENNLCMKLKGGGGTVCMFDGWATHPLAP